MADNEDPKKEKKNRGTDKMVCGYPLSIFFIVVNEFCERFSYYGMRAVLVLYFKYFLRWEDATAVAIYHVFVALCYLTPILGAIVADSWLGKFKTIIYLSIVYAVGQVAMAISAIHDITDYNADGTPDSMSFHVILSMVGLVLIALGTGGIKPCVAAFGGDQFSEQQDKQRSTFFSVFYLCINGGSLLSTIITPILRAQECGINSKQSCYSLAFGVPAALMVVALVVFIAGSGMYYKAKPQGNIMLDVCKCIYFAITNRYRFRSDRYPKREHWMDWAEEKYDKLLIAQIKMVLKVLFLYIPLPLFWTLFDQKGSRWTLQATNMDGNFGLLVVQPDQMQTINPILILTLVPIMDNVVYPLIKKCGLNFSPLKRMTVGMLLAATAFFCAAAVQSQIDMATSFPSSDEGQLKVINMGSTPLQVQPGQSSPLSLAAGQANDKYLTFNTQHVDIVATREGQPPVTQKIYLLWGWRQTIMISDNLTLPWMRKIDFHTKPEQGRNIIQFVNGMEMAAVNMSAPGHDFEVTQPLAISRPYQLESGKNTFIIMAGAHMCEFTMDLKHGSAYTVYIPKTYIPAPTCQDSFTVVENVPPNSVHMALQIPQYFFITAGEVMFSVTGLEFSYSQAPSNMKAVLQAGWLFTVAIGNFIVLIVDEIMHNVAGSLPEVWAEYVLFASLLVVVCGIFSIMAHFYTYIDPAEVEAEFKKKEEAGKVQIEMIERDSDSSSNSSSDGDGDRKKTKK